MDLDSVSLAYAYGCRNAGDFAINEGSLELLDRAVPDADVTAVSRFARNSPAFHRMAGELDGADVVGGPISYDAQRQSPPARLRSLAIDGLQYGADVAAVADDLPIHSTLYDRITDADMVLFNGGNAIHYSPSHRRLAYLLAMLYPLQVARRNDVPYGLLPQTIFGLEGVAKRLVVPILNDAAFVATRDEATFDYLSEFGLSTRLVDGVDTALLNGTPSPATGGTDGPARIAAVPRFSTLGDTDDLDAAGERMERVFLDYLDSLVEAGHAVTLTVQTEVDERWANRHRDRLDELGVDYEVRYDTQALRDHYAGMDLLVTMRLHAAIFALSVGTPTIGLYRPEWGPKTPGTFRTLGIDDYALTWEAATLDRLLAITDEALGDESLADRIADSVRARQARLVGDFERALSAAEGVGE